MANIDIKIDADKCKGCYLCVNVCPKNILIKNSEALNISGYYAVETIAGYECVGCLSCAMMCPDGAISLYTE